MKCFDKKDGLQRFFLGLCATLAVQGQVLAQQAATGTLERVEVTGSNIKRIDLETAAPVQIITREDIKATNANTLRQVLDTITASDNVLKDNGSSSSFSAGATGVGFRGLGKSATLVLLNGRRVSNFGLADGGKTTFTNIDTIPVDAIERIEVLKDGASAIYGSDAMAGVVNIITHRNLQGGGVSTSFQNSYTPGGVPQRTSSLVGGVGDFNKDGYNLVGNVEIYNRGGLMLSQVKDSYPAYYKAYVSPAFGDPSLVSYPGNIIKNGVTRTANPACPANLLNSTGACTQDLNNINQVTDPAERVNTFFSARMKLGQETELFGDAMYSRTQTDYLSVPYSISAPTTPFSWYDGLAKQVRVVNKPLLPSTHPLYAYGTGLEYRFMDPGIDWTAPSKATQFRLIAGAKGTVGGWDWEASVGRVGADAVKVGLGPYLPEFIKAIESNDYKVGATNSSTVLNKMFHDASLLGNTWQNHLDAKVSGTLLDLPAGPMQVAMGLEHRTEGLTIKSVEDVLNAQIIARGGIWTEGMRDIDATFAELEIPIAQKFTANTAVRYDKSSGFDGRLSPKLGLRMELMPELVARATSSQGFRTPNIPESMGKVGLTGFFNGTLDPRRCDTAIAIRDILKTGNSTDASDASSAYNSGCSVSLPAMISANPDIKPEVSNSATLGLVFQPSKEISISVDYFLIERTNEINYRTPSYVLARELTDPTYAALVVRNTVTAQDKYWADRANQLKPGANISWGAGSLLSMVLQYENYAKTQVSGLDIDARGRWSAGELGSFNLGVQATINQTYLVWDVASAQYRPNFIGTYGQPRLVGLLSGSWTQGPWTTGLWVNYSSSTGLNGSELDLGTWSESACAARLKAGDLPCYIKADYVTNASLTYRGFKGLTLSGYITNLDESQAPVDLKGGTGPRPRSFKVAANYTF